MAKKKKEPAKKSVKDTLLKEIESKITESVKDFHKKISPKKFGKKIHKAGKILSKSLAREQITVVHKKKVKSPKKANKVADKEAAS
jgi:hypothetical protein